MSPDTAEIETGRKPDGGPKARLLTLGDLDGRTRAAQQVRATITSIADDLGGSDHLSAAERALVTRAALVGAMCEDIGVRWLAGEAIDPSLYATLSNAERRLLETVGLKRVPRDVTPDLGTYLARKAATVTQDSFSCSAATELASTENLTSDHGKAIAESSG